ncbi:MAG: D-alanyl-D-alanine carboxypeptidase/D-alanyl-D-alanine-endopeptidase, partial [Prochloron sp. SP5CPC1]|nr:D-alanyl-D-alanine carboxypeptidase/D-alanyl-D-alanine-endopeptidase [Candidatus Paraprochloron terpiosi SP5CPC1]
ANSIEIDVPPPETNNDNLCPEFLEPEIKAIANRVGGKWGIMIQSLDDRTTLYEHHPDRPLIPASNVKILTAAAALQRLDPLTTIRSTSLREWVRVTLLRSNNNYANVLLRYFGGATAAKQALTKLGVNPGGYRLVDGSGLSRQNNATPRVIIQTLDAMHFARGREIFLASLPVAGVSGTLRNRLKATPVQGTVAAKTGTLRGVRALSGYMDHPTYGILIFSIMVNHQPNKPGYALVKGIDDIVLTMNNLAPCN